MQTAIEINRRGGYPAYAAWYMAHLGWLARLRGRDDEALDAGPPGAGHDRTSTSTPGGGGRRCAMLGTTLLLTGDRAGAIELFERGLAAAQTGGVEAYLLRCAAPLAAGHRLAGRAGRRRPAARAGQHPGRRRVAVRLRGLPVARPGLARARRTGARPRDPGAAARGGGAGAVDWRRWPRRSPWTAAPSSGWAGPSRPGLVAASRAPGPRARAAARPAARRDRP